MVSVDKSEIVIKITGSGLDDLSLINRISRQNVSLQLSLLSYSHTKRLSMIILAKTETIYKQLNKHNT